MTNPIGISQPLDLVDPVSMDLGDLQLSPESLMLYLSTRLGGIDSEIQTLFQKQQTTSRIQEYLRAIGRSLNRLKTDPTDPGKGMEDTGKVEDLPQHVAEIEGYIEAIRVIDPKLAESIEGKLDHRGFILAGDQDARYCTEEVTASQDYINSLSTQLNDASSLDMIRLQSLMSSRQTAIQLATNMVSALGESTKSIAQNIGR